MTSTERDLNADALAAAVAAGWRSYSGNCDYDEIEIIVSYAVGVYLEASEAKPATSTGRDLVERLESHMGKQDVPVLLADCRLAAARIRELADALASIRAERDAAVAALNAVRHGASGKVLAQLPAGEFETSSIKTPADMTRKEFYNSITYLTRIGALERLGYGRYRAARAIAGEQKHD